MGRSVMHLFSPFRHCLRSMRASVYERQFCSATAASVTLPHSPLAALEGLLVATGFSTLFWTLLTLAMLHLA